MKKSKIRHFYILFVFSILFLNLVFPIHLPHVRILIVTNLAMNLLVLNYRAPMKEFGSFIILIGLFFFSASLSSKSSELLSRDIANIILTLTYLPLLFSEINSAASFHSFKKGLFKCIFIISILVALIGTYKFLLFITTGALIPYFVNDEGGQERFRVGTSLVGDYNYYAYGLIMSMMTIPLIREMHRGFFYRVLTAFAFVLFSFNIFFSSSRRGVIILSVYLLIITFRFLWQRRDTVNKKLNFLGSLLIGVVGVFLVLYYVRNFLTAFDTSQDLNNLLGRIETTGDSESLTSSRFYRIEESIRIIEGYSPLQFLFGNGFDYIQELGNITGAGEDYPHNFVMSAALYGGIVGMVFTCFFAGLTYFIYKKKGQGYQIFLIWYVLAVFMLMTSKNSLFSVQFMILLFVLPYCNDNIRRKKKIKYDYVSD